MDGAACRRIFFLENEKEMRDKSQEEKLEFKPNKGKSLTLQHLLKESQYVVQKDEIGPVQWDDKTLIVKIAGKGNLITDVNTQIQKFTGFSEDHQMKIRDVISAQVDIGKQLIENVQQFSSEIQELIPRYQHSNGKEKVVIVFDGDNYQSNSPFTHIIAHLSHKYKIYGFKKDTIWTSNLNIIFVCELNIW